MHKLLLILALLLCAIPAFAANSSPNTYPKERITSAPGACHEVTPGDTRLQWSALNVSNGSASNVQVACSPEVDVSTNGTHAFGAVLTNPQANNRSMTCVATISSGGNGPKSVSRSVIVGPATSARIGWTAEDMGMRVLIGGQVGFICTLPPQARLSWAWTIPGA